MPAKRKNRNKATRAARATPYNNHSATNGRILLVSHAPDCSFSHPPLPLPILLALLVHGIFHTAPHRTSFELIRVHFASVLTLF
ncbi:hypothetical protein M3J09_007861 [Ascochyta lentis]